MYPFWMFCGKVRMPGRVSVAPVSSFGLLTLSTKPFGSPSVPGHCVSFPAPVYHVAAQALEAKSYAVPADGVTVGPPGVTVGPPGVTVGPETRISTHQGLLPCGPMPNSAPFAFLNIQ